MILIIIKFCELLLRISPRIVNSLRSYIKYSKERLFLFHTCDANVTQLIYPGNANANASGGNT